MVNVPGRSKGCNTCRRRKKGCDLQKPFCSRCLRDQVPCEGYDRSTVFVKGGFPNKAVIWPNASKPKSNIAQERLLTPPIAGSACLSVIRGGHEEGSAGIFWQETLPSNRRVLDARRARLGSYWWAEEITSLCASSPFLNQTLQCLYLALVASKTSNLEMSKRGFQAYGLALAKVNKILQIPAKAAQNDVLIPSISFLAVFEKFNGFTQHGPSLQGLNWQAHIQGLSNLLILRGPGRHAEGISFLAFSRNNMAIFAHYFTIWKSCPFDSDAWRTVPWKNRTKSLQDLLFDVLFKIPGVLEQVDIADSVESRCDAMNALMSAQESMLTWKKEVWTSLSSLYPDALPPDLGADEEQLRYLEFGADVAHCIATFWGVSLQICSEIIALRSQLPEPSTTSACIQSGNSKLDVTYDQLLAFEPDSKAQLYIRFITVSIPYFVHPDSGIMGFQNIAFPVAALLKNVMSARNADIGTAKNVVAALTPPSWDSLHGQLMGQFVSQLIERGRQM